MPVGAQLHLYAAGHLLLVSNQQRLLGVTFQRLFRSHEGVAQHGAVLDTGKLASHVDGSGGEVANQVGVEARDLLTLDEGITEALIRQGIEVKLVDGIFQLVPAQSVKCRVTRGNRCRIDQFKDLGQRSRHV